MHQPKTREQRLLGNKSASNSQALKSFYLVLVCIFCLHHDNFILKCEAFSFSSKSGFVKQSHSVKENSHSTPLILGGSCKTMVRNDNGSDSLEENGKRRRQGIPRLRNPRRRMRIRRRNKFDPSLQEETGTSTLIGSHLCEEDEEEVKVMETSSRIGLGKRIRLLGQNRPRIQNFRPRRNMNFVRNNWRPVIRIVRFRRKNDTIEQELQVLNEENTTLILKQAVLEENVQEYLTTEQSGQETIELPGQQNNEKYNKQESSNNVTTIRAENNGSIKKGDLQDVQKINSSNEQQIKKKNANETGQKGKRINITSKYKTSRVIVPSYDEKVDGLLNEYMTQPITSFSLRSFHDTETPIAGRRRWMIRSLSQKELMDHPNISRKDVENAFEDNVFRLAVPLMPLLGIDLTPIIDLQVMTATKLNDNNTKSFFKAANKPPSNVVRIRSLRMSLLATDNEMKKYNMNDSSLQKMKHPIPTKVSKDQSVRQMGNEAIHFAEKLEKWLEPQLSFEADISWNDDTVNGGNDIEMGIVAVDSKAAISLTIPPLPFGVPIPSSFLIKQIGSNVLKRALKLALNQFLRQVEIDFKRWADIDK